MAKKIGDSTELNYDMNYNLFLLKTSMANLKTAQGNYININTLYLDLNITRVMAKTVYIITRRGQIMTNFTVARYK